jgi:hypothetical protein
VAVYFGRFLWSLASLVASPCRFPGPPPWVASLAADKRQFLTTLGWLVLRHQSAQGVARKFGAFLPTTC